MTKTTRTHHSFHDHPAFIKLIPGTKINPYTAKGFTFLEKQPTIPETITILSLYEHFILCEVSFHNETVTYKECITYANLLTGIAYMQPLES